jgi:peptide/nickel transport system ATP-binding protein/oligopeptide transport system ATP-binding protein
MTPGTVASMPSPPPSGARDALIEVRQLRKHFAVRGRWFRAAAAPIKAVDGIDFVIRAGETFGLVGESGCGKSTTSRLLLRLETPSSGSVRFDGREVAPLRGDALRTYRRSLQAVFQDPTTSLSPRMTVMEIVGEPIAANERLPRREREARVLTVLREVGLPSDAASRYPHEFSGGQRQRIAIARALASGSRCIVLDEPVSALDISIRAQILKLLKTLQQRHGLTYLLISHDLAAVRYLSTRIGVMYLGKLVEVADTEALFASPAHPYTRALLSAVLSPQPDARALSIPISGEVPSARNPPSGCAFHPRCPYAQPICSTDEPPLRNLSPQRSAACHFAGQLESLPTH